MAKPFDDHFVVTHDGTLWQCRTRTRRVACFLGLLLYAGLFVIGGGMVMDYWRRTDADVIWHDDYPFVFTTIGLLTAVLLGSVGMWSWRTRHVPLVIEKKTGEVRLGHKRICGPGTVQYVLLRDSSSDPDSQITYDFHFRMREGSTVGVPSPLFCCIVDIECASALAEEVAAALNVELVRDF
jgi:hypothetical protein